MLILGSAALFDHDTPFPGYLALLPVVGTGLVILAGNGGERQWHTPLSASAPVQFLGGISYSLYLWHWPLIVLAPFALADTLDKGRLGGVHQVGILAAAIVLAWLSKVLVEDRGISLGARLKTRTNFIAMVAGMAAVALVAGGLVWTYDRHTAQAAKEWNEQEPSRCVGAAAMVAANGCADPFGPARRPISDEDAPWLGGKGMCVNKEILPGDTKTTGVCDFTGGAPNRTVVWVVGDSHGEQWQAALLPIAREQKWLVKLGLLGGCPFADIPFVGFQGSKDRGSAARCTKWVSDLNKVIVQDRPAKVFVRPPDRGGSQLEEPGGLPHRHHGQLLRPQVLLRRGRRGRRLLRPEPHEHLLRTHPPTCARPGPGPADRLSPRRPGGGYSSSASRPVRSSMMSSMINPAWFGSSSARRPTAVSSVTSTESNVSTRSADADSVVRSTHGFIPALAAT
ncbi:hypothetical protein CLV40_12574 [Actinokineospora auranticolor]|uniref:SGNH domain-containing protein n=1 Tax=Actinokineospora auranticolor TaxID=155976 RepID=A0A2S6GEU8_9PSEU|nr:hypothetical protein CLV40_12574 [Actinokineospora auranticolor]